MKSNEMKHVKKANHSKPKSNEHNKGDREAQSAHSGNEIYSSKDNKTQRPIINKSNPVQNSKR